MLIISKRYISVYTHTINSTYNLCTGVGTCIAVNHIFHTFRPLSPINITTSRQSNMIYPLFLTTVVVSTQIHDSQAYLCRSVDFALTLLLVLLLSCDGIECQASNELNGVLRSNDSVLGRWKILSLAVGETVDF